LGSVFDTSTRIYYCSVDFLFTRYCSVVFLFTQGKGARIGTATFLHCIERDDYTNKRYVD
jgi:hypothetical protein